MPLLIPEAVVVVEATWPEIVDHHGSVDPSNPSQISARSWSPPHRRTHPKGSRESAGCWSPRPPRRRVRFWDDDDDELTASQIPRSPIKPPPAPWLDQGRRLGRPPGRCWLGWLALMAATSWYTASRFLRYPAGEWWMTPLPPKGLAVKESWSASSLLSSSSSSSSFSRQQQAQPQVYVFGLTPEEQEIYRTQQQSHRRRRRLVNDTQSPWRAKNQPLCTREQVVEGRWVRQVRAQGPPYVTSTVHLRCTPPPPNASDEPWVTWKWQPTAQAQRQCEFTRWRTVTFCQVLKYATVLIMGDSLSWEQYRSLVQLLGHHTHQGYQHQSRELGMNIQQTVCQGKTKLAYRRDDHLHHVSAAVRSDFPTVLILNRGAHYQPDDVLRQDLHNRILPAVQTWLQTCQGHNLTCHLFWRTSVPGHPQCQNFTAPVQDRAWMEAWIANRSHYDSDRAWNYHWYDYQHQNEMMTDLWQESGLPVQLLDAYYLNVLRPDQHRAGDCLHSCYPGKMDVYNELLLHYLRQLRTVQDVHQQEELVHHLMRQEHRQQHRKKMNAAEKGDMLQLAPWHWNTNYSTPYQQEEWERARDRKGKEKHVKERPR